MPHLVLDKPVTARRPRLVLDEPEALSVEPSAEDIEKYRKMGVKDYRSPSGKLYDLTSPTMPEVAPVRPTPMRPPLKTKEPLPATPISPLKQVGKIEKPPEAPTFKQVIEKPRLVEEKAPEKPTKLVEDTDPSFLKRMLSIGGKGLWGGLGIIAWPFERIEYAIASPLVAATTRKPILPATKAALKTFIPGAKVDPEQVKTFNDFWGNYYKAITGEEAPEWYKQTVGGATSFLITPAILGKLMKLTGKGVKALPIAKKLEGTRFARLPEWSLAKLVTRAERGAGVEKATELGKTLGAKDLKKIAQELSRQTGKKISPHAIQLRLGQLIKGGIVAEPEKVAPALKELKRTARIVRGKIDVPYKTAIQKAVRPAGIIERPTTRLGRIANPIIEEFEKKADTLRKLGLLGEETYITKLPKKRIAELLKERNVKLLSALAKKYGFEIKFTDKPHTVGKALGVWDYKNRVVRVATGGKSPRDIIGTLTHEITHKLHGDIAQDFAYQMTQTGKGKWVKFWNDMTNALFTERDKVYSLLDIDYGMLPGKARAYLGKPTEVLARIGVFIKQQPEVATKELPRTTQLFKQYVSSNRAWKKFFATKEMMPLTIENVKSIRTAIENPKIKKLLDEAQSITDRIYTSKLLGGTKYAPRMYRIKEEERLARKFLGWSPKRIRAHYAKQRKNIPPEVRRLMGEIKEPSYPVMKRLIQESSDIELAKLFRFAAGKSDWADDVWRTGFANKPLPTGKAYGDLAGKFVHKRVYDDVTELVRIRGNFEQIYDSVIGTWKLGKVVWNPATHFRNKISNKILLDLSGMGFGEQAKYAVKALKHYKANSTDYQAAKKYFARTTLVRGEILDDLLRSTAQAKGAGIEKMINTLRAGTKKFSSKPSAIYQHEEFVNKFMKYLQQRDMGKSVMQSVLEANKWVFDYGDLTRWEINIARRVMPFYTFPRKAMPRVIEAAAVRPHTIAKYPLLVSTLQKYSLAKLKLTDKDYAQMQKVLPDYMKQGSYVLMPYRDDNGDLRFFDWTYIIPWGTLAEIQTRGTMDVLLTNPMVQLAYDIKANKNTFADRPIWKETDTTKEKTAKAMLHIWQTLSPSLAPKGLYWDKLYEAAIGKPSPYKKAKVRPLPETIAHTVFGLRTQPIDVTEQKRWRFYEKREQIKELRGKLKNIMRRKNTGNISKEEYDKLKKQYMKQIRELLKGR